MHGEVHGAAVKCGDHEDSVTPSFRVPHNRLTFALIDTMKGAALKSPTDSNALLSSMFHICNVDENLSHIPA